MISSMSNRWGTKKPVEIPPATPKVIYFDGTYSFTYASAMQKYTKTITSAAPISKFEKLYVTWDGTVYDVQINGN